MVQHRQAQAGFFSSPPRVGGIADTGEKRVRVCAPSGVEIDRRVVE